MSAISVTPTRRQCFSSWDGVFQLLSLPYRFDSGASVPVPCVFRQPVGISRRPSYLRIPRPHVHYEANQEEHDEDEETDSGDLSCGKSHKSKPKGTRYQRDQKENQRDGISFPSGI
jgi:hypothetical protein